MNKPRAKQTSRFSANKAQDKAAQERQYTPGKVIGKTGSVVGHTEGRRLNYQCAVTGPKSTVESLHHHTTPNNLFKLLQI